MIFIMRNKRYVININSIINSFNVKLILLFINTSYYKLLHHKISSFIIRKNNNYKN